MTAINTEVFPAPDLPRMPDAQQQGICLIVEDSDFDQKMMARAVATSGCLLSVVIVGSLTEARAQMAAEPDSIVLLDNTLPDGRGVDFALELARDPNLCDVPVMIVSDWPSPFMWKKAEAAGVHSVISKTDFGPSMLRELFEQFPTPQLPH